MKRISQYKKIIQEIAQKNNLNEVLLDQIIQNFYANLTKEINTFKHYNIYIKNLGYITLSPNKIKQAIKTATLEERQDRLDILNSLLQKTESRIQERIQRHNTSRKINKEKYDTKNKTDN